jgi:peptidyl-prolyl cis-trans isomerase SurA
MALLALGPAGARAAATPIDGIVAQVGDEIVLASEIDDQIAILNLRQDLADTNLAKAREEILDRIIDEKVIVQEARSRGITASYGEVEEAVQKHVRQIREQMGDEEKFQRELTKEGLTEDDLLERYREEARRELLYTRLIQREIYSKIEVSGADAEKYFMEHKSELPPKSDRVELAHVFIALRPDPEEMKAAQIKLKEIERRVAAGDSFAAIARALSDDASGRERGGDLGWMAPGDLDPRLMEAIGKLAVGEISDPMQTSQGVEILRVADRDSARVHLQHIRVNLPVSDTARERSRKGAEEVRALAVQGADFPALAKEYSDDAESKEKGGNLGFFASAELTPNIAAAVRNLKPGEVSEVVPSDVGYHVFKLLSREGGGEWTYEEVKDRVVGVMVEERAQAMTDSWLQSVRSKYFIRRADGRTGAPTGPPPESGSIAPPESGSIAPPESVASPGVTAGHPAQ